MCRTLQAPTNYISITHIHKTVIHMFTKEGVIPTPSFHLLSPLVCKGISWLRAWLPWLPEADAKKRRAGYSSPSKRRAIFHLFIICCDPFTADDVCKECSLMYVYCVLNNNYRKSLLLLGLVYYLHSTYLLTIDTNSVKYDNGGTSLKSFLIHSLSELIFHT